jgi:hypothetical protein
VDRHLVKRSIRKLSGRASTRRIRRMRNSMKAASKTSRSPNSGVITAQDFSVRLGWLIVEALAGGVLIEDQITVLQCALDALREAFMQ